jgi:predicted acylesterase/phospholipase RssA
MPEPRRAVVLSGGGAKGIFESGVVHALAQTGYEADVITGSSVGALNAVGYAEVVRARRDEGPDASLTVADSLLTLWQQLDRLHVADFDAWAWRPLLAALGLVVFGFALVAAAFSGGGAREWLALLERTGGFLLGALGVFAGVFVFGLWLDLPSVLRKHVWKGRWGEEAKTPARPSLGSRLGQAGLRLGGFVPSLFGDRGLRRAVRLVVPAHRRLSEYRKAGLDVRLTRTNVRTGRTEISEFLEARDMDRPGFDRGLRVIGDPRAVEAALASSAFPGAFPAVAADAVYVAEENRNLYARAKDRWLAKQELKRVFGARDSKLQYVWLMSLLERLSDEDRNLTRTGGEARLLERIRSEFYGARTAWNRVSVTTIFLLCETRGWPQIPVPGEAPYADRYIDGGILDNTPLATALTALREAAAEENAGSGTHEMLVVLLSPRKRGRYLAAAKAAQLQGPALGLRALRLQAEGRIEDDVRNAEKIDRLLAEKGWAEEELAAAAHQRATAAAGVTPLRAQSSAVGESWAEVFTRERGGESDTEPPPSALHVDEERLVRVQVTRVYPTWDLPWILSLDRRLGFRADDARQFQVRGCRDTLAALSARYGDQVRSGREVPVGARRAVEWTGSRGASVAAGWICPSERCSLRATCDLVATDERLQAETEGAAARA